MGLLPDLYTFSDLLRLNQLLAMNKRPIKDSGQILGFTLLIGDINLCVHRCVNLLMRLFSVLIQHE